MNAVTLSKRGSPALGAIRRATLGRGLPAPLRVTLARLLNYLACLGLALLLWQALVSLFAVPAYLMPSPAQCFAAMAKAGAQLAGAVGWTVFATLLGMAISLVLATLLAMAFIACPLLDRVVMPLILLMRTVPMIAVAPILVLVFGREQGNTVGMVVLLTFFQIMLAAKKGFQAPSSNLMELMHTCGASFWQTLFKVRLPCALPYLFTGLRIAAGTAILCAMFAEWLSGAPGLGSLMLDAYARQDFALMWAAVLASTSAAYVFFTLTIAFEVAVIEWAR